MSEWLGQTEGQYLIVEELGHGAASEVYRAY